MHCLIIFFQAFDKCKMYDPKIPNNIQTAPSKSSTSIGNLAQSQIEFTSLGNKL